jgi:eukaryotic-like serine/threonine-protein kinase
VIGREVGPYRIVSKLGEGGMGEVYRARDSKLGRDVAVKILPELFVADPDRVARFEREAQALAALNHPNIAAIYGVEDAGPTRFLVLELVDGESLADKLARPEGRALQPQSIARGSVADGLQAVPQQAR